MDGTPQIGFLFPEPVLVKRFGLVGAFFLRGVTVEGAGHWSDASIVPVDGWQRTNAPSR